MKVLFLDIDGVLNSYQSATFWHNKRDQNKWENELYEAWKGTLKEYLALEFCPIALSNLEELCRRLPDLKIVVSSTWRLGETVESLKKIFSISSFISNAIIDVTPRLMCNSDYAPVRGDEIKAWLNKHPDVTNYVIIDDDSDMLEIQKPHFVQISELHGFQWIDMLKVKEILL